MEPIPSPLCTHADQLRHLDGRIVRLAGIYLGVPTLKKMPRPGRPREEVHLGEVVIALEGSAAAYDPMAWDEAPAHIALGSGPRPREEIAAFGGRRVEVEGRLVLRPGSGEPPVAAATRPGPTLLDPVALRLAE